MFVADASERREVRTRQLVAELLARGLTSMEVARVLGISKSTVCYHKRRLGHEINAKFNRRYDWAEVQRYYDLGHTITECELRFGFARKTFMDAAKRGDLFTTPHAAPIVDLPRQGAPHQPDASQAAAARGGPEGEPLRVLRHRILAGRAAVDGAPSRQRRRAR